MILRVRKNNGDFLTQTEKDQMLKFYFHTQIMMPHIYYQKEEMCQYWLKFIDYGIEQFHNISYEKGLVEGTVTMEEIVDHHGETNIINKRWNDP